MAHFKEQQELCASFFKGIQGLKDVSYSKLKGFFSASGAYFSNKNLVPTVTPMMAAITSKEGRNDFMELLSTWAVIAAQCEVKSDAVIQTQTFQSDLLGSEIDEIILRGDQSQGVTNSGRVLGRSSIDRLLNRAVGVELGAGSRRGADVVVDPDGRLSEDR